MKSSIFILTLLSFSALLFKNLGPSTIHAGSVHQPKSYLVLYGEKVYEREACASCHTQHVERADEQWISLDGIGGKYSHLWLYYYLQDPRQIIPESMKPSYAHLHEAPMKSEMFFRMFAKKASPENRDTLWKQLEQEAQGVAEMIEWQGGERPKLSEVLALIAYIDQIPASPEMERRDSLARLEFLSENRPWEKFIQNSDSLVRVLSQDTAQVKLGQLLFERNCTPCHGMQAQGIIGPNLTDAYWLHGSQVPEMARTILYGVPQEGMISWQSLLSPAELGAILSYLLSVRGTAPEGAKAPQGVKE